MELKLTPKYVCKVFVCLLIVPYGIETLNNF